MGHAQMTAGTNKQVLQRIFDELSKGNSRLFVEALSDDVIFTVIGTTKWSGTHRGKQAVLDDLLRPLTAQFADRYKATASQIIAENDRVVVEFRGAVTTKSGIPYNNAYCWVCRMAGGKILELTEYCDTALVETAFPS
jgi:ketosteroid isomerase-like protein